MSQKYRIKKLINLKLFNPPYETQQKKEERKINCTSYRHTFIAKKERQKQNIPFEKTEQTNKKYSISYCKRALKIMPCGWLRNAD